MAAISLSSPGQLAQASERSPAYAYAKCGLPFAQACQSLSVHPCLQDSGRRHKILKLPASTTGIQVCPESLHATSASKPYKQAWLSAACSASAHALQARLVGPQWDRTLSQAGLLQALQVF